MARGDREGRRRGHGGRGQGDMSREVQVSKKLSYLLRHGAEKEGLKMDSGGWVVLQDILENRNIKSLQPRPSFSDIRSIVATNEKQRFSLIHASDLAKQQGNGALESDADQNGEEEIVFEPDSTSADEDPTNWLIRANQGHSLQVKADDLLKPISAEIGNIPNMVVHGTTTKAWQLIVTSGGLKPMGRNHVHFATGVPKSLQIAFSGTNSASPDQNSTDGTNLATLPDDKDMPEKEVISGMRASSSVLVYLDIKKALESTIKFWMSDNGVVLSAGNQNGIIPLELFERVEERGGKVLVKDGSILSTLKQ